MVVSAIVAASQNGVIGKAGALPWNLPADMAFFKRTTAGHPVIMGRKTHESVGRPLPHRLNIIISHDKEYKAAGCLVVDSLNKGLSAAAGSDEVFIIGGGQIYQQAMPKLDKIYLSVVKAEIEGDAFFKFDKKGWRQVSAKLAPADSENRYDIDFQEWVRD